MNDSDIKDGVANSTWYITVLDLFNWKYKGPMETDAAQTEENGPIGQNHGNEDGNNTNTGNNANRNTIDAPQELEHKEAWTEETDNSNTNEEMVNNLVNCTTSKEKTDNAFEIPFKSSTHLDCNDCRVIDLELSGD